MARTKGKAEFPIPHLYRIGKSRVSLRCDGCKVRIQNLSTFVPRLEKQIQSVDFTCDLCIMGNVKHKHSNATLHDAKENLPQFLGRDYGTNSYVKQILPGIFCHFCAPIFVPKLKVKRVFLGPQRRVKIENTSQFVIKLYCPRKYRSVGLAHPSPRMEGRMTPSFVKIYDAEYEKDKQRNFLSFQKQNFEAEFDTIEPILEPPENFKSGYFSTLY